MAYGGRLKALRVSHTAHALHDILGEDSEKNWIYYNNDFSLVEELRSPTHGIESWALHSTIKDKKEVEESFHHYWEIGINNSYFNKNWCDIFFSFDYQDIYLNPRATPKDICMAIYHLLAPGGKFVYYNLAIPQLDLLCRKLTPRYDIVKEFRRYSLFDDKEVGVFQKDDL